MGSWAIRSTEDLPILTYTWILEHTTIPPKYMEFFLPWCTEPGLFAIRRAFLMCWISSRALPGKIGNSLMGIRRPSTRRSEPPNRQRSPHRSFFFHMSRRHTAVWTDCWPNTTLNMSLCRLRRSPVSFVLWRTTWEWEFKGFTAYPASFVKYTSGRLVDL